MGDIADSHIDDYDPTDYCPTCENAWEYCECEKK